MIEYGCEESAYRKHAQERCFASILQADHGYVHFRCPAHAKSTVNTIRRLLDEHCLGRPANAKLGWTRHWLALHRTRWANFMGRGNIPKKAQEPVIDGLEETCH